ncbi:hypothetical protein OF83DRAFT_630353 [Amylostereum chailletii]|nr:hypothetical protein OF83DRAFT_630353 [Amylostereum chailletii]
MQNGGLHKYALKVSFSAGRGRPRAGRFRARSTWVRRRRGQAEGKVQSGEREGKGGTGWCDARRKGAGQRARTCGESEMGARGKRSVAGDEGTLREKRGAAIAFEKEHDGRSTGDFGRSRAFPPPYSHLAPKRRVRRAWKRGGCAGRSIAHDGAELLARASVDEAGLGAGTGVVPPGPDAEEFAYAVTEGKVGGGVAARACVEARGARRVLSAWVRCQRNDRGRAGKEKTHDGVAALGSRAVGPAGTGGRTVVGVTVVVLAVATTVAMARVM